MPTTVQIDFLLPNGVLVDMPCFRDASLEKIKVTPKRPYVPFYEEYITDVS